ncbi:RNA-binding protein [Halocatena marina]|uniref:RNA-binding protein n=1 Tax=Halocatena marina TaxID=2934937 RepID=A0ABD5YV22_9EURY|nr:RNA-binding protein [Halocatena marina]
MQVKSRHHLRGDEIRRIETTIERSLGVALDADSYERVDFDDSDTDLVLVDGDPFIAYFEQSVSSEEDHTELSPFLTVRGANAYPPQQHVVTVDTGAISFVSDGADVMRPGIAAVDDGIESGDLVAISEESHGKILAIGRARVSSDDLLGDSGKVIDSLHHVGDELYQVTL